MGARDVGNAAVGYAVGPGRDYTTFVLMCFVIWAVVTGRVEAGLKVILGPQDKATPSGKVDTSVGTEQTPGQADSNPNPPSYRTIYA